MKHQANKKPFRLPPEIVRHHTLWAMKQREFPDPSCTPNSMKTQVLLVFEDESAPNAKTVDRV